MTTIEQFPKLKKRRSDKTCDLCGCVFLEWGNNPHPFIGEVCCDSCNEGLVIPARMALASRRKFEEEIR